MPYGERQTDSGRNWSELLRMKAAVQPVDLELLADRCETLEADRQRWGLAQVLHLLGAHAPGTAPTSCAPPETEAMWVGLLADSGAYESAAVALLPEGAAYTCGRLGDGSHVAQIVLPGGGGAHSRGARTLSMAIVAALLRALGRDLPKVHPTH